MAASSKVQMAASSKAYLTCVIGLPLKATLLNINIDPLHTARHYFQVLLAGTRAPKEPPFRRLPGCTGPRCAVNDYDCAKNEFPACAKSMPRVKSLFFKKPSVVFTRTRVWARAAPTQKCRRFSKPPSPFSHSPGFCSFQNKAQCVGSFMEVHDDPCGDGTTHGSLRKKMPRPSLLQGGPCMDCTGRQLALC